MPRRTKEDNEKGAVLFWQWVQKAKAKQHKQCAHNKKSIFNGGIDANNNKQPRLRCLY